MKRNSTLRWSVGIGAVIAALLVSGRFLPSSQSKLSNREVALLCTTDMATQFHIHPRLEIIVSGQPQEIPANIGIGPGCMHPLHTHDASGTIHVESPQERDFTLADFFAVWNKTFSKDEILGYTTDATHRITMTVNGKQADAYENTTLRDNDQITINYGNK